MGLSSEQRMELARKKLKVVGTTYKSLAEECNATYGTNYDELSMRESLRRYLKKLRSESPGLDKVGEYEPEEKPLPTVLELLQKKKPYEHLLEYYSKRDLDKEISNLQQNGYRIIDYKIVKIPLSEKAEHNHVWQGDKTIRFAIMGDTQINSKYTQITHLHRFYDIVAERGIDTVYHTGDIDEGDQMRMGHQYECYNQGADDHVDEIVRVYPHREGITTYFITGNHDHSFIKRNGLDIGKLIAAKRPDMIYLGQSSAIVNLTPNCKMELRHPIDGTAYAISYKMQKMIEAFSGGEKPQILAVGHYHKNEYLFYRNVHAVQTSSFQAQTNWMRGKGISASIGGWIIEVDVSPDGQIDSFRMEHIPFYSAIKDDYKNWR